MISNLMERWVNDVVRGHNLEDGWKIAAACRCAQEVREFMPDPEVGN